MSRNFGNLSELENSQGFDDEPDWIPKGFSNLDSTSYNGEEFQRLNPSIRSKIVKSGFQSELESGVGRDKLMRYISSNVDGLDHFDSSETIDLKLYILDILDSSEGKDEGELLGEEVFDILNDYIESDGEPDFLQRYEVVIDDASYC